MVSVYICSKTLRGERRWDGRERRDGVPFFGVHLKTLDCFCLFHIFYDN